MLWFGKRKYRGSKGERKLARAVNMNIREGHLGGYIRASDRPAPSGLDITNGDPATYSARLWRWVYEELGVRSVLDVGCGEGHSAAFFRDLGCEVVGVDGSIEAKQASVIPEQHVVHDFTRGPYIPETRFDLVWSCEFVEHVEAQYMPNFLASFNAGKRYLMLTYAEPGQPGWHHVNCQRAEYWIEQIAGIGFRFDQNLTDTTRTLAEKGHYARRGLTFVRA